MTYDSYDYIILHIIYDGLMRQEASWVLSGVVKKHRHEAQVITPAC